jgi:hypothetical protein
MANGNTVQYKDGSGNVVNVKVRDVARKAEGLKRNGFKVVNKADEKIVAAATGEKK